MTGITIEITGQRARVSSAAELKEALAGAEGWLGRREAWELHRAALAAPGPAPIAVEIGSWKGRSTLALGLAFRARGAGTVIAVDPHTRDDTLADFERNVAPVREHVRPVLALSPAAREQVDETIDLLFVDGSHRCEDVLADIDAWSPLLREGATVAFHDAQHEGVGPALRERVLARGPFRRPRLVQRTLLATYETGPWSPEDEARAVAVRAELAAATVAARVRRDLRRRRHP
ncbi:MAG TPA: class I SAM-dependent methyltransferase [Solirubrobacteraceae bacterium]